MPIYKNMKNAPLPLDTAEGNALSVRGKGSFHISRATELSPRFQAMKAKKLVKFVKEDPRDKPKSKLMIQEAPAVPPELVSEEVPIPSPETVSNAPASDAPGHVSTADESASVAPVDVQPSEEVSDAEASGAAEPQPGKGATSDDEQKSKKRRYRRKKTSSSED